MHADELAILCAREIHKCQEPTSDWRFLNFLIHDKRIYVAVSSTVSRQEMSSKMQLFSQILASKSIILLHFISFRNVLPIVVRTQIITSFGWNVILNDDTG